MHMHPRALPPTPPPPKKKGGAIVSLNHASIQPVASEADLTGEFFFLVLPS